VSVSKNLADIVLAARLVTGPDLARAARRADETKQPLVVALVRDLGVDELALVGTLRKELRLPLTDPAAVRPDPDVLREVPRDVCRRLRALPLTTSVRGGTRTMRIAMADPTDLAALVELEAITGCEIEVTLVPLSAVEEAIEDGYRALVTEVVQRKQPFGASLSVSTQPLARSAPGPDGLTPTGTPAAPATIPYHRLSDEADLAVRHQALLRVLLDKNVLSEDEYEEAVRELLKRRDEGG
jgi:hypothetical protein